VYYPAGEISAETWSALPYYLLASVQSMSSSLMNLSSVTFVHVSTVNLLGYAVLTETCTLVFSSRPGMKLHPIALTNPTLTLQFRASAVYRCLKTNRRYDLSV
jgi:hypothetical protein